MLVIEFHWIDKKEDIFLNSIKKLKDNLSNFYFQELEYRREQKNPPFSRLIRLSNFNPNRALSERKAFLFSDTLRSERDSWGYSGIEILGPTPSYPARVRGQYRWQIILRGANPRILLDKILIPKGWIVDVDPLGIS